MLTTSHEHRHVSSAHHFRHALSHHFRHALSQRKRKIHFCLFDRITNFTEEFTASHEHWPMFMTHESCPCAAHTPLVTPSHKGKNAFFSFFTMKIFHNQTYRQSRTWACLQPIPLWSSRPLTKTQNSFFFFDRKEISQRNLPPATNMGMCEAHTTLVTPSKTPALTD